MTTKATLHKLCSVASDAESSDFDLHPEFKLPENRKLREAAVLVPIIDTESGPSLILTKRASHLKHHPGQIAFPGGKRDQGDKDLTATALREAREEIGLAPENVDVVGVVSAHETVTGFTVSPILGYVRDEFVPQAEQGEVAEIFRVPLAHVLNPDRFTIESRFWRGVERKYYVVPYGPYYIWGATARILRRLAEAAQS
ncbi:MULTISPECIES: CoA pyrophosphatase [Halocynthiibacter]|uniref:CoA pyrophosphatase n=1 Tax=Halocynthiibacter halioticoli TaxID=2986804 RepID=A0AAE3J376_9RHOB|nr:MULTISPECIES: CoA pyrophosphatase [Halocynthiibacter]MCV6825586.1 CoA pyrophosphatase [Halocynthiibacter halioticoli]MCW4058587.1 CoA pyrophosphatase [Halocynthiibacter sp. SDUM655004]MDE0590977.1 CoA pyrophosphatase [Halocynthiibacter sp. C4]